MQKIFILFSVFTMVLLREGSGSTGTLRLEEGGFIEGESSLNLADEVLDRPYSKDLPPLSSVIIRGVAPRYEGKDPHPTLKALRDFHVTRLQWIYSLTPDFIKQVKEMGITVSAAAGTNLSDAGIDTSDPKWQDRYSIKDLNGKTTTATWMRAWKVPGLWYCVNNPEARSAAAKRLASMAAMGVLDIQRDDPIGNVKPAIQWGACYCPHCMEQFRSYLQANVHDDDFLKKNNIASLENFDYRAYLLENHAPVGDAFEKYRGGELKKLFVEFQAESTVNFHRWWRAEVDKAAGRHVPVSANIAHEYLTPISKCFDFYVAELDDESNRLEILHEISRTVSNLGRTQILTMPELRKKEVDAYPDLHLPPEWIQKIRHAISMSFCVGMNIEAPWDAYVSAPTAPRYFGEPADYSDLFAMVRAVPHLLEGYQEAAATGGALYKDQILSGKQQPVTIWPLFSRVGAFTRVMPGNPDAPIVIHLMDWRAQCEPFTISLNPQMLFKGRSFSVTLITPKPYDKNLHEKAFASKEYQNLVNQTPLGDEFSTTFSIPQLNPWGILVLTPSPTSKKGVWSPRPQMTINSGKAGYTFVSDTPQTSIHYTEDGTEVLPTSPVWTPEQASKRKSAPLRLKAFSTSSASVESLYTALIPNETRNENALKNTEFSGRLDPWRLVINPTIENESVVVFKKGSAPHIKTESSCQIQMDKNTALLARDIALVQPLQTSKNSDCIISGTLESDQDLLVNVKFSESKKGAAFCKEVDLKAGIPQNFKLYGHIEEGGEFKYNVECGNMQKNSSLWVADPKVTLSTTQNP
ncbi:MAG: hypothetical protein V4507_01970 [Verrucomicrobiota bacterium]